MATFVAQQAAKFDAEGIFDVFKLTDPIDYLSAYYGAPSTGFLFSGEDGIVVNGVGAAIEYSLAMPYRGTITELHVTRDGNVYFDLTGISLTLDFHLNAANLASRAPTLFSKLAGGNDSITGSQFDDTLQGMDGNDVIAGRAGSDIIDGGQGNDSLDGGFGADTMRGGTGNDTYFVDNVGDIVEESNAVSGGIDTVWASVNFSLADSAHAKGSIEELVLVGSGDVNVAGDDQAEHLIGNIGANTLRGGAGNDALDGAGGDDIVDGGTGQDTLRGGQGNDTYIVDNPGDVVDESGSADGIDTVLSSISFSLADVTRARGAIENLTLTGSANADAIGNELANVLLGNVGPNKLTGGLGKDTLGGGPDKDVFHFGTELDKSNVDKIIDFSSIDTIELDNSIFTKMHREGELKSNNFGIGKADSQKEHILLNKKTGMLSYDPDGSGKADAEDFAQISKAHLDMTKNAIRELLSHLDDNIIIV